MQGFLLNCYACLQIYERWLNCTKVPEGMESHDNFKATELPILKGGAWVPLVHIACVF